MVDTRLLPEEGGDQVTGAIGDLDTAWDRQKVRGLLDAAQVVDDGEVEGMGDVLDGLSDRYSWLVDEDAAGLVLLIR